MYGIPRVVVGENRTFYGGEDLLRSRGVEVVVLDNDECVAMMTDFIAANPELWNEDIGEEADHRTNLHDMAGVIAIVVVLLLIPVIVLMSRWCDFGGRRTPPRSRRRCPLRGQRTARARRLMNR